MQHLFNEKLTPGKLPFVIASDVTFRYLFVNFPGVNYS